MIISIDVLRKRLAMEQALFRQALRAHGLEVLIAPSVYTLCTGEEEILVSPQWVLDHCNDRELRGCLTEEELDMVRLAIWADEITQLKNLIAEEMEKGKHH